jgi:hypothetical protein
MPRPFRTALLALAFVGAVGAAAHAQAGNAYQTTWAALDPGDDWAAQVLRSIFPIGSGTALQGIGAENTVIGKMVGQFSGFIIALAAAFMAYTTVVQIHRAAESGNVLSNSTSSWAPVRLAFALSMMFPLPSGFSTGQAAVMQTAIRHGPVRLHQRDQSGRARRCADRATHDPRNKIYCHWPDRERVVCRPGQRRVGQPESCAQPDAGQRRHPGQSRMGRGLCRVALCHEQR